ncbi:unnamed protein product [Prorocentrum cordatum]|uniref:Uncharacterized protein n=1 Tax=Prorocentrum cordatum TaxID=2364126 RepID=A0ABN9Y6A2_9DINO|nr:unnamed protein product [Polarella glacialis]
MVIRHAEAETTGPAPCPSHDNVLPAPVQSRSQAMGTRHAEAEVTGPAPCPSHDNVLPASAQSRSQAMGTRHAEAETTGHAPCPIHVNILPASAQSRSQAMGCRGYYNDVGICLLIRQSVLVFVCLSFTVHEVTPTIP